MKAGLVIIFNHKFNKNIPNLQKIYGNRFSKIYYIVPFYTEYEQYAEYNIIPVYETSYCFQGYITQAIDKISMEGIDHLLFIGDDMILNPNISEDNYSDYFNVGEDESYITEMKKITEHLGRYVWRFERVYDILSKFGEEKFVNYRSEIPQDKEAFEIAGEKGITGFELDKAIYVKTLSFGTAIKDLYLKFKWGNKKIPYPIMAGYSDIFLIAKPYIAEFSRLCGVFAAMGVFVESAIPTAMMLSCGKIKDDSSVRYKRGDMWGLENKENFRRKYDSSYSRLIDEWDDSLLFIHPIKLSKWKVD
jgi:hypothetical protein